MLILNKDLKTIQNKTEKYFEEVGINITPGSIAKLFSSIINSEISEFYQTLTTYHMQCFVTTATGTYLEAIGKLLNCNRKESENDDDYRYRIINQILVGASANKTAITLAALSVNGVDNVVLVPFTKGAGSFDLYVVNSEGELSEDTINDVRNEVSKVVGYGINFNISEPIYKNVSLKIKLMFKNSLKYIDKDEIAQKVVINIYNYINNLDIGKEIVINQLSNIIMNSDSEIANFICEEFKINNTKCMFTNQYLKANEKFIIDSNYNSIIVN